MKRSTVSVPDVSCPSLARVFFFFSSRRRHTRYIGDWSSDVCSSDLERGAEGCGEVKRRTGFATEAQRTQREAGTKRENRREKRKTGFATEAQRTQREARSEERRVGKESRRREETEE